ncbi:MAG TPA: Wzz/FepE/Etk N-terminal domain-containing protein [Terracidiphilus sp.]|nr:Wzz/FepE/Etk N-terminal domain-containing protein [Terracidiphilus sp.]
MDARDSELHERSGSPATPGALPLDTPENAPEISLVDLLIVLSERKRIIITVTAACAVLAVIVSLLLPNRYTATITLLPPQQSQSMSSILSAQLGGLGGSMAALAGGALGLKNPNDMYVAMFKSRTVEDSMVKRFGLMAEYRDRYLSDARKDFEKHFEVDSSSKDGLIHISVEDRDPVRAAKMANGYVEQFRILSEHLAISEASQRRLFFEQQLQQAKDNLGNAEEALKKTEQKTGVIQLDSQARALIESAATLRAQISAKEVQLQGIRSYATGENSQLIQTERELDAMRAQLAKLGGSEDLSDSLIVPKGQVPQAGLEYARKLRNVKYYEAIFEILARQYELAKLDEAREGALIQVVDPAVTPDRKSFPKRTLIVLVSTIVGFFLGILVALSRAAVEKLKDRPELNAKLTMLGNLLKPSRFGTRSSRSDS